MKRTLLTTLAVGFVWSAVGAGSAHAQLSRSDQLFLYLNYYQQQRNAQVLRDNQVRQQMSLDRLGQGQSAIVRNTAPPVPSYSRYVVPGRSSPQVERAQVPPIYSGQRGNNWFMQHGRFYSPPR